MNQPYAAGLILFLPVFIVLADLLLFRCERKGLQVDRWRSVGRLILAAISVAVGLAAIGLSDTIFSGVIGILFVYGGWRMTAHERSRFKFLTFLKKLVSDRDTQKGASSR